MRLAGPKKRVAIRTWSWPAFFGSFTWFFYRKMYTYGAMLVLLPIAMSYLVGSAGGGATWAFFAVGGKKWYVYSALNRMSKADKLGLAGAERSDYLRRAGGVSLPAGIFAGLVYACLIALAVLAAVAKRNAGHR
jgi:hypothetical protein